MTGKRVGKFLYLHRDQLDERQARRTARAQRAARIRPSRWNVAKLEVGGGGQVSLLKYRGLEELELPELVKSWTTSPRKGLTHRRRYSPGRRPVFHEKWRLGYGDDRGWTPAQIDEFYQRNPGPPAFPATLYGIKKPKRWTGREGLTVLSSGLGRDSMTMLLLALEGNLVVDGKPIGIDDIDAVAWSDPGHEWPHTYALVPRVEELARRHGFRFIILSKPPAEGPHGWKKFLAERKPGDKGDWKDRPWVKAAAHLPTVEERALAGYYHMRSPLISDYERLCRITLAGSSNCTFNHKIEPINRRLLDDLFAEKLGLSHAQYKRAMYEGKQKPSRVLLGIASDEPRRLAKVPVDRGYKDIGTIVSRFPLVEAGIAKGDEQEVLERHGFGDVRKSGCFGCHAQSVGWFWALKQLKPEEYRMLERAEEKSADRDRRDQAAYVARTGKRSSDYNVKYLGPPYPKPTKGRKYRIAKTPLSERVAKWRRDNPLVTVDQVLEGDYQQCGSDGCSVELETRGVLPVADLALSSRVRAPPVWKGYGKGKRSGRAGYKAKLPDGGELIAVRGKGQWSAWRADRAGKRELLGRFPTYAEAKEAAEAFRAPAPAPAPRAFEQSMLFAQPNPNFVERFGKHATAEVGKPLLREDAELRGEVFDLIDTAYSPIGGHINIREPADVLRDRSDLYRLRDIDADPQADVLQVMKTRPFGRKSVGVGHDGSRLAKRRMIADKIADLKSRGHYTEVSGRMAEILLEAGVPVVDDEDLVRRVLAGKRVTWHGRHPRGGLPRARGWYTRKIAGEPHTKLMVGVPHLP